MRRLVLNDSFLVQICESDCGITKNVGAQGSVLELLVILVYINDLPEELEGHSFANRKMAN